MIEAKFYKTEPRIVLNGEFGGWKRPSTDQVGKISRYGHVTLRDLSLDMADAEELFWRLRDALTKAGSDVD